MRLVDRLISFQKEMKKVHLEIQERTNLEFPLEKLPGMVNFFVGAVEPASKEVPKKGKAPAAQKEGLRQVSQGERPPLKEAISIVMGGDICNSKTLLMRLKRKGWAPNAKNPRNYISIVLANNKDVFERTDRRGHYSLKARSNRDAPLSENPKAPEEAQGELREASPTEASKELSGEELDNEILRFLKRKGPTPEADLYNTLATRAKIRTAMDRLKFKGKVRLRMSKNRKVWSHKGPGRPRKEDAVHA